MTFDILTTTFDNDIFNLISSTCEVLHRLIHSQAMVRAGWLQTARRLIVCKFSVFLS